MSSGPRSPDSSNSACRPPVGSYRRPRWIVEGTSVYVKQSKADIGNFLAQRPDAPVSSFIEIYDGRHFHPLNDLFHGIAQGPEDVDGDVEYLRRRLNQEHFRRHMLSIFATHGLDFLVYPTVQVIPPTRDELAAEKYQCLTFPTNTVIGLQAGLPALTIPVGYTGGGHRSGSTARRPAGRGEDASVRPVVGAGGGAEARPYS